MKSPDTSADKPLPPSKRRRWLRWFTWRRARRTLVVFAVLTACGYWIENVRGRRAFQQMLDSYAAAGVPLDPHRYLAVEPPAAENFATPLLDGIAAEDGSGHPGEALAIKKRRRLGFPFLQTGENNKISGLAYWKPPYTSSTTPRAIDWKLCRKTMSERTPWSPPPSEPSDVQAVYLALDAERAVFDELLAASPRKSAVFTPSPASLPGWRQRRVGTDKLTDLLRVRASAAATLGKPGEAAALAVVLWRFREALMAEPGDLWSSVMVANQWIACAEDVIRSGKAQDADLAQLLERPAYHWQPEEEWLRYLCAESAAVALFWQEIVEEASWSITGDLQWAFKYRYWDETRKALLVPKGWLAQNGAAYLRSLLEHRVKPLRDGGLPALPAAEAAWNAEWFSPTRAWWEWYHPYRYFLLSWNADNDISLVLNAHTICRLRLTLLAIGMERYRLAHGRYPADPAALVPQFLPSLPPDMDHAPLRCITRADGTGAVLYSIGWNLADDWHGVVPAGSNERRYNEADWALELPLPTLAPP